MGSEEAALAEEVDALRSGMVERIEATVSSNMPGREQTVCLARESSGDYLATTNVVTGVDEQARGQIFEWNERYPLVTFRFSDGDVTARLTIGREVGLDTHLEGIEYLASVADRLEYEVGRGADVH